MNKKILYGFLPIFLCLVVLFIPIKASAVTPDWEEDNGIASVEISNDFVFLNYSEVIEGYYDPDSLAYYPFFYRAMYSGVVQPRIKLTVEPGSYYNGSIYIPINFHVPSDTDEGSLLFDVDRLVANFNLNTNIDGVSLSVKPENEGKNQSFYLLRLQLNNFCPSTSSFYIPFDVSVELGAFISNEFSDYLLTEHNVYCETSTIQESVLVSDDLLETYGTDSYFAWQNEAIIENTGETNGWLINIYDLITDGFNRIFNKIGDSSSSEIQANKDNTNTLANGYDNSQLGISENKFESGAGDLTDIEDSLTDSSSDYVDGFTTNGFDTSFLESVGPSLNYVVTWFTNFWNMGGALTSTYGLSFAIFIAFYILRVRG